MLTLTGFICTVVRMKTSRITTIFFDLDGTLLPFDEREFFHTYVKLFGEKCESYGLERGAAVDALLTGFSRMLSNDGTKSNEEVFWDSFNANLGCYDEQLYTFLIDFYTHEFNDLQRITHKNPSAKILVNLLKEKGYNLVLATNPVFPHIGTVQRLSWADLTDEDFALITTYEDFHYTKPHIGYYRQLCEKMGVSPHQVLMIGNDVKEDGAITQLGSELLLIQEHLINRENFDTSDLALYTFCEVVEYCRALPDIR